MAAQNFLKNKSTGSGYADVLIGLQYGDEGKARVVDMIAKDYDIIARFNGGANAGHTIETNQGLKVALQQIPSGIFYPDKILYIGSGCVVNIEKLAVEIDRLKEIKVDLAKRLKISCQASIIQPHHVLIDAETGNTIGTTKNGIGPCYADKAYRMDGDRLLNIKLGDLKDDIKKYLQIIRENLVAAAKKYSWPLENTDTVIRNLGNAFRKIRQYIESDTLFMEKQVASGKNVLFEGAQSIMLDVTKGSVPYVTSSNTVAAAAHVGGDLSTSYHRKTIGIAKAVMSRVGYGPFASELGGRRSEKYCMEMENSKPKHSQIVELDYDVEKLLKSKEDFDIGIAMRILSAEYGTVTTRPRRVGMLDLVQLKYAIKMNGVNELIINKCDMLNVFADTGKGQIPIVTGYVLDGENIDYVPGTVNSYYKVKPVVVYKKAFKRAVSDIKTFDKLPGELQNLIIEIEKSCGCRISGIGVGPERDQFVRIGLKNL